MNADGNQLILAFLGVRSRSRQSYHRRHIRHAPAVPEEREGGRGKRGGVGRRWWDWGTLDILYSGWIRRKKVKEKKERIAVSGIPSHS